MSHRHSNTPRSPLSKSGVRRRVAGAGAALAGFVALGLGPVATAPAAHADLFDFDWLGDLFGSTVADSTSALDPSDTFNWADLASWFDPSAQADLPGAAAAVSPDITSALDQASDGGVGSLAAVDTAPALAATTDTTDVGANVAVPITMTATTEPVVNISVGGGQDIPVVLDTGSNGLVIPWYDIGLQNLFTTPTGSGFGAYSGGMDYFYVTLPETVDFGGGAVTTPVGVDAVLFAWPASLSNLFNPAYYSLPGFLGPANADGVLGIAPDAVGPDTGNGVLAGLPGDLGQGVLINEPAGQLVFGPSQLTGGTTVAGVANSNLAVSVGGGAVTNVGAIIDSGGVFGTMPSSAVPADTTLTASGTLPASTPISVYDQDGQLLYQYSTGPTPNGVNGPLVISGNTMNTGYVPFSQMPVYLDLSNPHAPTTTFYNSPIEP
ncbi:MAG TPA: PecA family PE domain-processing aspartic protease [Mycobacterium sp.]